jgi:hypothetical protein
VAVRENHGFKNRANTLDCLDPIADREGRVVNELGYAGPVG